jgi:GWxTD domain-containing protein
MKEAHMKTTRLLVIAAVALSAAGAFAGSLTRYKGWENTPEGYFMTPADRTEWRKLQSDDEAEKWIAAYEAKRGEQFKADVSDASAVADKYFTVGKTRGSATERGKLIILLGPPGSIAIAKKKASTDIRATPEGTSNIAVGGGGNSVSDMVGAANSAGSGRGTVNEYTITYPADKLPAGYGKPLVVKIEMNNDGTDYLPDHRTESELARVYEMVAAQRASGAPQR